MNSMAVLLATRSKTMKLGNPGKLFILVQAFINSILDRSKSRIFGSFIENIRPGSRDFNDQAERHEF